MTISHSHQENKIVFQFVGKLDTLTAPQLELYLADHLQFHTAPVIFDLSKLEYIASAGLRLLLLSAKKAKAAGQTLALHHANAAVLEVLTIAGFTSLFQLHSEHDSSAT